MSCIHLALQPCVTGSTVQLYIFKAIPNPIARAEFNIFACTSIVTELLWAIMAYWQDFP